MGDAHTSGIELNTFYLSFCDGESFQLVFDELPQDCLRRRYGQRMATRRKVKCTTN
jgi:hypothetical protein